MRKFGLIGYPLTHSFSEKYFTDKFRTEGIAGCRYNLYSIPSIDQLPSILQQHPEGLNVTIPYKKAVLPFLNQSTQAVQQIGACNCIHLHNGQLTGHNTDVAGFEQTLVLGLQSHNTHALVLGTGGASAAVEYVLKKLGIEYALVSRTSNAAKNVLGYDNITKAVIEKYTVIINTTPLGTYPAINTCPAIPYKYLSPASYLYDLVYNPAETMFLKRGKNQGATIKNGEKMLEIQAEESWKIWNS